MPRAFFLLQVATALSLCLICVMETNKESNNGSGRSGRVRKGRQKIDIKRITKEDARQVCFSKRRNGLIKKAGEMCILCGAEIAIIVYSPAGKVFSFGHPSVDAVFNRFLNGSSQLPYPRNAKDEAIILELSREHDKFVEQIEAEKKRNVVLQAQQRSEADGRMGYWDADLEQLSPEQLEDFKNVLEEMRTVLSKRQNELMMGMAMMQQPAATADHYQFPAPSLPPAPFASISSIAPLPFQSFHGNYNTDFKDFMATPFTNSNNTFMGASNPYGTMPNCGQYFYQ